MNAKAVIGPLASRLAAGAKGLSTDAKTVFVRSSHLLPTDAMDMGTVVARMPEYVSRVQIALSAIAGFASRFGMDPRNLTGAASSPK